MATESHLYLAECYKAAKTDELWSVPFIHHQDQNSQFDIKQESKA